MVKEIGSRVLISQYDSPSIHTWLNCCQLLRAGIKRIADSIVGQVKFSGFRSSIFKSGICADRDSLPASIWKWPEKRPHRRGIFHARPRFTSIQKHGRALSRVSCIVDRRHAFEMSVLGLSKSLQAPSRGRTRCLGWNLHQPLICRSRLVEGLTQCPPPGVSGPCES
jgi:hypothetical protein